MRTVLSYPSDKHFFPSSPSAHFLTFAGVDLRTNLRDLGKQGLRPFIVGALGEIAIAAITPDLILEADRFTISREALIKVWFEGVRLQPRHNFPDDAALTAEGLLRTNQTFPHQTISNVPPGIGIPCG